MLFVVVSRHYQRIISMLEEEGIYLVKRKGPQMFFYASQYFDQAQLFHFVKGLIKTRLSVAHIFEVYNLYNGMIDLTAYLPEERKKTSAYYNQSKKDLSQEEFETWKQSMNIK